MIVAPLRKWPPSLPFDGRHVVIRGGSGLGDSIYLQSVVRHFLSKGCKVETCTSWPDVFRQLTGPLSLAPFRKDRVTHVAHYAPRKSIAGTDQFQDCCINAGITEPVEFKLGWTPRATALTERLRREPRPVICVMLARKPMDRPDDFGAELAPDWRRIQQAIDALAGRALLVQIGKGASLYRFNGIDLDMSDRTTVADVLDVASIADGFLGYCSFLVPLAEGQRKPGLFVWSRRGLMSKDRFVARITPQKVLHRKDTSRAIVDNCSNEELARAAHAFCDDVGRSRAA